MHRHGNARQLCAWPNLRELWQRSAVRLFRIVLVLALLVLVPFFIWGDALMAMFEPTRAQEWIRERGALGWLAVIGLLVVDLFLPIPATGVMSAAGFVYGPWFGGFISFVGSFLAGLLAYGLSRAFGIRAAEWLAGKEGLAENEALFQRAGPWLIILSRWLPVLPEVVSCLAGLARMPFFLFLVALVCGTLPPAFTYAAVGALFDSEPLWALLLSVLLPVLLWLAFRPFLRARQRREPADS
jgi:uncharacterized membrane protein YdjX (TVP38/TMEM64 family)